jgi:hypothetical protein
VRGRALAALALAVLLSGCSWMDGSYVSVTPHEVAQSQTGEGITGTVSNYAELRSALVRMVDEGSTEALFTLKAYPRDVAQKDVDRAVEYVTKIYPIGSYAVASIDTEVGTGALSVDITYSHTAQELAGIRTVRGMDGAEKAIAEALDECADKLVLQISGFRDVDYNEIVAACAQRNPDRVMETPRVTFQDWPDRGEERVVELLFFYQTDRETLRAMREQVQPVFSSAALYVTGQASERTKFSQLHAFLMERFDYRYQSSRTPAYSLLCEGVGDSRAFAQVYAAMCSRIGLEAASISGTRDGEKHHWNLVRIDGVWYHLDLLSSSQFRPMTEEELTGYEWDRDSIPAE